eukprot:CAMPEP_0181437472 /NCGR_PEP_ID=MMETSP1110-20121109/21398_1 /TAXON_ID=174948 /ORGANISM="Symbiodinium sp., Strain CCMP421" /LENGTH=442 /DNA_ID=CAMNT_0023561103 /DNA_START=43 /DNA_END=1372 /DNA_ORIENTATION=+
MQAANNSARRGRSGGRSDTSTERSSKGPSDPRPSSLDCCRLKLHRSHRFRSKSVPSTGAPKKTVLAQGQAPSNCPAQKAEAINSNVATPSHTSSCTSSSTSSTVTTFSRSTTSPKSPPLTSTLPHDAEEFLEGGEELSPLKADSQESLQLTQPLSSLNPEAVLEFWPSNEMQKALFLDYDGTLREFEARPDLAVPTPELMRLLQALNDRQDIRPFIVSGRDADFLAQHFAGLNGFTLIAEHGYHISPPTDGKCQRTWELLEPFGGEAAHKNWKTILRDAMSEIVTAHPGTSLEEKHSSLVWHYRESADKDKTEAAVLQALANLNRLCERERLKDVKISRGHMVVEASYRHIRKGQVMRRFCEEKALFGEPFAAVLVAGDDVSDETMFEAAPPDFLTIKVGEGETIASYRADTPQELGIFFGTCLAGDETAEQSGLMELQAAF